MTRVPTATTSTGTRLQHVQIQALSTVIIVVDLNQLQQVNFGQLADYIGMVGLAQIRADADNEEVPSILSLLRHPQTAPQALTVWDQALLRALYTTSQANVMQASAIKVSMVKTIEAH